MMNAINKMIVACVVLFVSAAQASDGPISINLEEIRVLPVVHISQCDHEIPEFEAHGRTLAQLVYLQDLIEAEGCGHCCLAMVIRCERERTRRPRADSFGVVASVQRKRSFEGDAGMNGIEMQNQLEQFLCRYAVRHKGPGTWNAITSSIDAGHPIVAFIDWIGHEIGHYVVISGYDNRLGAHLVLLNDPNRPQPVWVKLSILHDGRYHDRVEPRKLVSGVALPRKSMTWVYSLVMSDREFGAFGERPSSGDSEAASDSESGSAEVSGNNASVGDSGPPTKVDRTGIIHSAPEEHSEPEFEWQDSVTSTLGRALKRYQKMADPMWEEQISVLSRLLLWLTSVERAKPTPTWMTYREFRQAETSGR